ncbi:hypothetical protein pipiens_009059, partial [Culex pipiens pipiens]
MNAVLSEVTAIKTTVTEIERSQNFISAEFEKLRKDLVTLGKDHKELANAVGDLHGKHHTVSTKVNQLELEVDRLTRAGITNYMVILGLPTMKGENTTDLLRSPVPDYRIWRITTKAQLAMIVLEKYLQKDGMPHRHGPVNEHPANVNIPAISRMVSLRKLKSYCIDGARAAEAPNRLDTQRALSFYYQNVRGLRTKIDDLFLAVIDCDYDVIVLTETWLDDEIFSPQLFGTGYVVYRNDRDTVRTGKKTGGGICIAVSKKFDSTEFPVPTDASSLEQLWVVINGVADQKLYVGSVYISPDLARNSAVIESHFNSASAVAEAMRPNDLHLLLGDYNQPKITWTKFNSRHAHPSSSSASYPLSSSTLLDGVALLGMKQLNDVSNNLNRTLDLVLIDDDSVNYCSVAEAPEALLRIDPPHPPLEVTVSLRMPVPFIDEPDTRSYNFYKADFPALNRALLGVNWNALNEMQNVDEAVAFFNSTLKTAFRDHVPTRAPPRKPPWSNDRMKKLKRRRAAALRKYSARRNP